MVYKYYCSANVIKGTRKSFKKERKIVVTWDLPKWSYLQCLLSRGDRRVGKIIMAAHLQGGSWVKAYGNVDINPDFYTYRQRDCAEILPWDFIEHGVSKQALKAAYEKALSLGSK